MLLSLWMRISDIGICMLHDNTCHITTFILLCEKSAFGAEDLGPDIHVHATRYTPFPWLSLPHASPQRTVRITQFTCNGIIRISSNLNADAIIG